MYQEGFFLLTIIVVLQFVTVSGDWWTTSQVPQIPRFQPTPTVPWNSGWNINVEPTTWQPQVNGQSVFMMTTGSLPRCVEADQCYANDLCNTCLTMSADQSLHFNSNSAQCRQMLADYPEIAQMTACESAYNQDQRRRSREECEIDKRYELCINPGSVTAARRNCNTDGSAFFGFGHRLRRAVMMAEDDMNEERSKRQVFVTGTPTTNVQYTDTCRRMRNTQCGSLDFQCLQRRDPCQARRQQEQEALNRRQDYKTALNRFHECMESAENAILDRLQRQRSNFGG